MGFAMIEYEIPNEKSADQMFEELGYEKIQQILSSGELYIEYYNEKTSEYIKFWGDKTISKYEYREAGYLSMQELKAINKKCEELGWL